LCPKELGPLFLCAIETRKFERESAGKLLGKRHDFADHGGGEAAKAGGPEAEAEKLFRFGKVLVRPDCRWPARGRDAACFFSGLYYRFVWSRLAAIVLLSASKTDI
jgi:hypothetical protein